jgi:hypothetical protein
MKTKHTHELIDEAIEDAAYWKGQAQNVPELLAALKEALANLEYLGLRDNKLPGMMQRIKYAIAKAEGNA